MAAEHDKLQQKCFVWLWNNYPETRRTFWHTPNEQRRYPGETERHHISRIVQAKSIGVLKGVVDLVWYWKGKLHCFDIKVGADSLSDDQRLFLQAIIAQGGTFTEVRSEDDFKVFVNATMLQK